ncbi:hypothetical protein AZG88_44415 [Rhodococcus sp. LB1]|nr:hypothetical protein AZG88_44415 [Rhodococcus sp. LB1]
MSGMFTPLIVTAFDGFGVTKHEGDPSRRPLTYDEIQALFDAADARIEQIRAHHRNGATAAMGTPLFSNRCTRSGFAAAKPGGWSTWSLRILHRRASIEEPRSSIGYAPRTLTMPAPTAES